VISVVLSYQHKNSFFMGKVNLVHLLHGLLCVWNAGRSMRWESWDLDSVVNIVGRHLR